MFTSSSKAAAKQTVGRATKYIIGGIAAIVIIPMMSPFAIVPAGHRGVMTTFGKPSPEVFTEGIHFRMPIANAMHLVDIRVQKGEGSGDAASKDLQQVNTRVALNYHIIPESVVTVFSNIGFDVGPKLIVPSVQEAVKAATALYTAEELITKRQEVRSKIRALLDERLVPHGIAVDEVSITNFEFSKSFSDAVEAKTTAEQQKLKAERDLERIRVEAEQRVAQARAEAESLRLQKQEVTPELLRLREIENQKLAIEKWNGKAPETLVTNGAQNTFMQIPLR